MKSLYEKILEEQCQKHDVDFKLVSEIIKLNEHSNPNASDENLKRKKKIKNLIEKHLT
jgi:hypothetical protein